MDALSYQIKIQNYLEEFDTPSLAKETSRVASLSTGKVVFTESRPPLRREAEL